MNDIILKIENLNYFVDVKNQIGDWTKKEIIKNLSFNIERNTVLGITGESGSGKTSLAKILAGINKQSSGNIEQYFNKNWDHCLPKPIQILFQNDGELINPYRKVNDVLEEAYQLKFNSKKDYSTEILSDLKKLQLSASILNHKGYQLSGGEQQRLALERILIVEPEILILDEPFSSQDIEAQSIIVKLIKELKSESKMTILCISHDISILKNISDNLIVMYNGSIVESGKTSDVFKNPENSYTKFLIRAQSLNLSREEIEIFHNNYEQN